jgi:uncharacterized pyridoxal phosphate-containing UPF0001 family protein
VNKTYLSLGRPGKVCQLITGAVSVDNLSTPTPLRAFPRQLSVFVQVNTSGEPQKYGVAPESCVALSRFVAKECPGLTLQGLMTIGKYDESAAVFFEVCAPHPAPVSA